MRGILIGGLLLLAACGPSDLIGESKMDDLRVGMPLDSVVTVLGEGKLVPNQPADSLRLYRGFRQQQFLVNGTTYRVLWYREAPGNIEEEITREKETPVLFAGDTVIAAGWSEFDDKAAELNIPNPYRTMERLDSISKSQLPKQ